MSEWENLFRGLVNVVPEVDDAGTTVLMDAFKGSKRAFDVFQADVDRVICVKHRADAIKKILGAKDAKTALDAIYAKTPHELEMAKSRFSKKVQSYMGKTPDDEQYPCLNNKIGHHTTSQGAESGNKSNLDFRTSHFGDVLGLADKIVFRFDGRKKDALEWSDDMPPKRLKAIKKELDWSSSILPNQVKILNSKQVLVTSNVEGRSRYLVNLRAARDGDRKNMCDGIYCSDFCRHFFAACRVINKPFHTTIPRKQTSASWRAAYEKCASPRLPSSAEIEAYKHLRDESLCLPPVLKARTGRPSKHKRHKGAIEQMNDRNEKTRAKKKQRRR